MKRLLGCLVAAALLTVLGLFGVSLVREIMVWHDREWDYAFIESLLPRQHSAPFGRKGSEYSGRRYRIKYHGKVRKITIMESIDFQPGDSIRVVYSPDNPTYFKVKLPSILWVGVWGILYAVGVPLILYYCFLFFWGLHKERSGSA